MDLKETSDSSVSVIPMHCLPTANDTSSSDYDIVQFVLIVNCLVVLNAIVLAGNILVIAAVFTDERLRSVTNTFVASLAIADLLLGLTVLPFSSANQVLQYWPFGGTWCTGWLAVDVWLCTASILNLCAISLDRYLAIGYSFHYPRLMSPRRAKLLVACVWVASFLICFPPLIGWKRAERSLYRSNRTQQRSSIPINSIRLINDEVFMEEGAYRPPQPHWSEPCAQEEEVPQCQLNFDSGYVIYSACGSFWIPMCVMVFFYWKIYVTASRYSRALGRGFVVVQSIDAKGGKGSGSGRGLFSPGTDAVALRVHRGGGRTQKDGVQLSKTTKTVSCRAAVGRSSDGNQETASQPRRSSVDFAIQTTSTSDGGDFQNKYTRNQLSRSTSEDTDSSRRIEQSNQQAPKRSVVKYGLKTSMFKVDGFQARSSLHRLNKEKRAAKTIGIIVGCFIACWMPFFTVYLLGAFCDQCTSNRAFPIFTWLGYFNSAMNPFLYALCSRDFRTAFKKLLRCHRISGGHGERFRRRTRTSRRTFDRCAKFQMRNRPNKC